MSQALMVVTSHGKIDGEPATGVGFSKFSKPLFDLAADATLRALIATFWRSGKVSEIVAVRPWSHDVPEATPGALDAAIAASLRTPTDEPLRTAPTGQQRQAHRTSDGRLEPLAFMRPAPVTTPSLLGAAP